MRPSRRVGARPGLRLVGGGRPGKKGQGDSL